MPRGKKSIVSFLVCWLLHGPALHALEPGQVLVGSVFPAVGKLKESRPAVAACTATLVGEWLVLTAAHCVCEPDNPGGCARRATFEFPEPYNLEIPGNLRVHPEFGTRRWLNEDLAVIHLDFPSSRMVGITPIPVEHPGRKPVVGSTLQLIGYGHTGADCRGPRMKKRLVVNVSESNSARLMSRDSGKRSCPGDSGGPMLNPAGSIVGVMSWAGDEINGRPTYANYNFIFNLAGPSYVEDRYAR